MKRKNLPLLFATAGLAVAIACGGGDAEPPAAAPAETPASAVAPASAPSGSGSVLGEASGERPRFVAPIRGEAQVGHTKPNTKVQGDEVVTTIQVKNMSGEPIAGLRVEEFWWDRNNNPLPADSQRLSKPLMPGEVATIELHTPRSPGMNRNSYKFSHANGTVKTTLLEKIEAAPETES